MAIHQTQAKVKSDKPYVLATEEDANEGENLLIRNDGAVDMFIGGPDVTAAGIKGGLRVPKETTLPVIVPIRSQHVTGVYAITAAGETTASALRV